MKKLHKSNKDRKISGVCGGIAEYFNVDYTLVRLGFIIVGAMAGCGVIAYIVASLVMPEASEIDE